VVSLDFKLEAGCSKLEGGTIFLLLGSTFRRQSETQFRFFIFLIYVAGKFKIGCSPFISFPLRQPWLSFRTWLCNITKLQLSLSRIVISVPTRCIVQVPLCLVVSPYILLSIMVLRTISNPQLNPRRSCFVPRLRYLLVLPWFDNYFRFYFRPISFGCRCRIEVVVVRQWNGTDIPKYSAITGCILISCCQHTRKSQRIQRKIPIFDFAEQY